MLSRTVLRSVHLTKAAISMHNDRDVHRSLHTDWQVSLVRDISKCRLAVLSRTVLRSVHLTKAAISMHNETNVHRNLHTGRCPW